MATLKELEDGTYSIDDILDMNIAIKWRADQIKEATDRGN